MTNKNDKMIKEVIAPLLKKHGFKKRARNWKRVSTNLTHVVNFQSSYGTFTLNFGVHFDEAFRLAFDSDPPEFPKEYTCHPRFRPGALLSNFEPRYHDKWWDFEEEGFEEVKAELEDLLENFYFPFADRVATIEDALEIGKKVPVEVPFTLLGVLYYLSGDVHEGIRLIEQSLNEVVSDENATRILKVIESRRN